MQIFFQLPQKTPAPRNGRNPVPLLHPQLSCTQQMGVGSAKNHSGLLDFHNKNTQNVVCLQEKRRREKMRPLDQPRAESGLDGVCNQRKGAYSAEMKSYSTQIGSWAEHLLPGSRSMMLMLCMQKVPSLMPRTLTQKDAWQQRYPRPPQTLETNMRRYPWARWTNCLTQHKSGL